MTEPEQMMGYPGISKIGMKNKFMSVVGVEQHFPSSIYRPLHAYEYSIYDDDCLLYLRSDQSESTHQIHQQITRY